MSNKMLQSATKRPLQGFHYAAVELRYQGKTYPSITAVLSETFSRDFKEQSVRRWFADRGLLHEEYLDYATVTNKERRELIVNAMHQLLPLIPRTFEALLNRKDVNGNDKLDMVTLKTLKLLCDYFGVKEWFQQELASDKEDPIDAFFKRQDAELGLNQG